MANILDLGVFKKQTLPIRMPDGKLVHIKKPTQAMTIELLEVVEVMKDCDEGSMENYVDALYKSASGVLNHNTEGIEFDDQYIRDEISLPMLTAIYKGYCDFMNEVQNQKN